MRKNSDDSSSGIFGPTVVALPSTKRFRKKGEKQTGGKSCLLIVAFLLLVCLHTIWQVNFQLILEDHAKRALEEEASQVYTMLRHRLPTPSHTSKRSSRELDTSYYFHSAASKAYSRIIERENQANTERAKFDVSTWTQKTAGGLLQEDREMLGRIYGQANSVFEFGLGESSYIANHVGVQRFSGIDSDITQISTVRDKVSGNYRFYFADVGMTGDWGTPTERLNKAAYDYQVVPLLGEPKAFDIYMLDGRFRVGCLLMSFLHASSSLHAEAEKQKQQQDDGDDESHDGDTNTVTTTPRSPTVLVHDCWREAYHVADHLLDLVEHTKTGENKTEHSAMSLCAYKRKIDTTDEQLFELWSSLFQSIA